MNSVLFKKLIRKGIKVFEYYPRFLHGKSWEIDDKYINIGSFNFDTWSWDVNNEVNIEI